MQLVEQHIIKKSNPIFSELDRMTFLSKNLYNQALYQIRQEYFNKNKYLKYNDLARKFSSERQVDYIALPAKVSQWVLKQVDKNFISFFNSIHSNNITHKVHIPRYLNKNGRNLLTFTNQAISVKELKQGYLKLSGCEGKIPVIHKNINQVRVVPKNNYFVIEVIYNQEIKPKKQSNNFVGIDLGLNNLATIGGNNTKPMIVNGRLNKYYEEIHNSMHLDQPCPHYEGGQIVDMQLWQVMSVLGPHMSMTCISPIYNCNIFIKKEDLHQTSSIKDYEKEHN